MKLTILMASMAALLAAQNGVSVNGAAERIASGSPLFAAVALEPETKMSAVTVALLDAEGRTVDAAFQAREERTPGIGLWTLSPEACAALPAGRYTVQAGASNAPFELVLDLAPDASLLSRWERLEGRYEKAIELAESMRSVEGRLRKAEALEARGDLRDALAAVNEAIRMSLEEEKPLRRLELMRQSLQRRLTGHRTL